MIIILLYLFPSEFTKQNRIVKCYASQAKQWRVTKTLQSDAPYRGNPKNDFYKLANQNIFLLVHKIQNYMFFNKLLVVGSLACWTLQRGMTLVHKIQNYMFFNNSLLRHLPVGLCKVNKIRIS